MLTHIAAEGRTEMAEHHRPARPDVPDRHRASARSQEERKQRVLTHGTPAITPSIAHATIVKQKDVFLLTRSNGDVPITEQPHGFGLYYHGCRYLDGYELQLAGTHPGPLVSTAARGYAATLELTNPDLRMRNGTLIPKDTIGIRWDRVIEGDHLTLHDRFRLENFGLDRAEFPISITLRARFDDIFVVRGMVGARRGTLHPPAWKNGALHFTYDGIDHVTRSLTVHFSPAPARRHGARVTFQIALDPRERCDIQLTLVIAESASGGDEQPSRHDGARVDRASAALEESTKHWLRGHTQVRTESVPLTRLIERSMRDLGTLRTWLEGQEFFAAGVPWFVTLFGRDSLVTALQTLAFDPGIAAHTLRLLARYQGAKVDAWRDEQPGKILHELRVDELTKAGMLPYSPYFGTVDATPLFLILIGQHAAWTGDLGLFDALRPNVERALEWMERYGDTDGDGYIDYRSSSKDGLINQGWKDSGDAIVNADGSLATPPIALVEVQGYAYMARRLIADLFRRAGDGTRADALERDAAKLKARFNHDFWMPDQRFFALALQAGGRPAAVISSNPGQALWTGIVDADKTALTVHRLMDEDMFSGWGIRTLSARAARYNPVGYHLGTVWPHDNAIIAAGFRRCGFTDAAQRVADALIDAATHFRHLRLPELFTGFERRRFGIPVRYPVACHPQAWAAGSTPLMLQTLLGLVPNAFERELRIVHPLLPRSAEWLELHHIAVGDAHADLRFERAGRTVVARVLNVDGDLNVTIENSHPARRASA